MYTQTHAARIAYTEDKYNRRKVINKSQSNNNKINNSTRQQQKDNPTNSIRNEIPVTSAKYTFIFVYFEKRFIHQFSINMLHM